MKLAVRNELCSGCRTCEVLCAMANYGECNPKKSALRVVGHFPAPGKYEVLICSQCGTCADACPMGAITLKNGAYIIDKELCTGCFGCVEVCPSGMMFTYPKEPSPIKCKSCGECVEFCPRNALYDAEKEGE